MFVQTREFAFEPFVSMRRLESLLHLDRDHIRTTAARAGQYYEPFDRRRGAADKWRHIDNPTGPLKPLQSRIYHAILRTLPFDEAVIGGVKGRSTRDNARLHVAAPALVTLDVKNCFPSISDEDVFRVFRWTLNYSGEIAGLLTKLTTFQHRLPQGAPTSSVLANLVLLPLHEEVRKIAHVYGLQWSMYVDDVAFSGERAREAIEPTIGAMHRLGFSVRAAKVKVMPAGDQQRLTGIIVNRTASAGRERIEEIRTSILALHSQPGPIYGRDVARVRGQISYVTSVNAAQGATLLRLADELLPQPSAQGPKQLRGETRSCSRFGRHRTRSSALGTVGVRPENQPNSSSSRGGRTPHGAAISKRC